MSLATLLVLAALLWSVVGCALAPVLGRLLRDSARTLDEPAVRVAYHERPRARRPLSAVPDTSRCITGPVRR